MPFKSKAQRRKFAELLVKGEISPETYEEWNRQTGRAQLPERVTRRTKAPGRTGAARARSARTTAKTPRTTAKRPPTTAPAPGAGARRPAARAAGRGSKKTKKTKKAKKAKKK